MRQLCPTATCTARATMHDSHAATIPARDLAQGTRRAGTSRRRESVGEDTGATYLARHQTRCGESH